MAIYKEFKVLKWDSKTKKPIEKVLSEREKVSINYHEAELNNIDAGKMKLWYELAEDVKEEQEGIDRASLYDRAKELGLNPAKNIKTDKLIEIINEAEK